jgi:hypothetical protein
MSDMGLSTILMKTHDIQAAFHYVFENARVIKSKARESRNAYRPMSRQNVDEMSGFGVRGYL